MAPSKATFFTNQPTALFIISHPIKTTVCLTACLGLVTQSVEAGETTEWTAGDGDVTGVYDADQWIFGVEIDSLFGEELGPDDVLIKAGDNARLAIPSNPNFSFLGADGDPVWVYPESHLGGIPNVGINTLSTPSGVFVNDRFDLSLNSVNGPGNFFLWTVDGGGAPTVRMNTSDGVTPADVFSVPSTGHKHMSWGFSSPGTYRVGFVANGTLNGSAAPVASGEAVYTFEVSVLKQGEADIEVAYEAGELEFHIHDETSQAEFNPAHVALHAGPDTWTVVPEDESFAFLGEAGAGLNVFSQEEVAGRLFLGLAAELPAGVFVNDEVSLRLVTLDGPGHAAYYQVDGFGVPTVYFNSRDGLTPADAVAVAAGTHAHRNWAFDQPGVYRLGLQASGSLVGGGEVISEITTVLFEVFAPIKLERGEIDLEIVYAGGEWELALLDEAAGVEYQGKDAVLVARPPARQIVPTDPSFDFLGEPGATVYVLPQEERGNVLFLGLAADEIAPGLFVDETVNLQLASITGPGEMALYEVDAFGVPTVFWNSADGMDVGDTFPAGVGGHTHVNWAFTQPGLYRLSLRANGTLVAGNEPVASEVIEFRFEVRAPVVFAEGELDFEVVYAAGEWELVFLNEDTGEELETDEALLIARPAAFQLVPSDPAFTFLGEAGSDVHILPQGETGGLLFPGLAGDEIAPGVFVDETVNLLLVSLDGPGQFALYEVDAFGGPTVYMNTRDGIDAADFFPLAVGAHTHANWAFSTPGEYRVEVKAAGTLVNGGLAVESDSVVLTFIVQPAGPLLIATLVNDGADLRLTWNSRAGTSYQLQSRTQLGAGGWTNEGSPVVGDGSLKLVEIPLTNDPLKVFQIVEQ